MHLLAALLVVALVQAFFVKIYQVPSVSMENTLLPGDRLLVNRLAYTSEDPQVGDIVVFERPDEWRGDAPQRGTLRTVVGWFGDIFGFGPSNSDALVKRVIAGPGDTVSCCSTEGSLERNGQPIEEDYLGSDLPFEPGILDCEDGERSQRCFAPLTIPDDNYLMLGDNRANSSDGISLCRGGEADDSSGCARLVSREDIVGEVFFVVLPLSRWGAPQ
ncbi:signal peptidase I [Tessaracoccus caeni]|uniref:signal peptidase I n=1 Tax=Tessaracoccus caeni TaxID=3031239 RepID=UPI0023DAE83B|nr:signal peptidase I [Tessaracoccus caeni]MDF1487346.1 signal peptidase I [Tessaracoccus caeni]